MRNLTIDSNNVTAGSILIRRSQSSKRINEFSLYHVIAIDDAYVTMNIYHTNFLGFPNKIHVMSKMLQEVVPSIKNIEVLCNGAD